LIIDRKWAKVFAVFHLNIDWAKVFAVHNYLFERAATGFVVPGILKWYRSGVSWMCEGNGKFSVDTDCFYSDMDVMVEFVISQI
jgi:hypothetical protein